MTALGLLAMDPNDGPGHMNGWGHMDGWGPMGSAGGWLWLWGLLTLIGIAILITVLVLVLTRGRSARRGERNVAEPRTNAQDILDQRYARGELTTEEYHERLQVLRSGPGASPSP